MPCHVITDMTDHGMKQFAACIHIYTTYVYNRFRPSVHLHFYTPNLSIAVLFHLIISRIGYPIKSLRSTCSMVSICPSIHLPTCSPTLLSLCFIPLLVCSFFHP
ncbi:hypothetical protein P154DRAFT_139512 [Amniculicola lignicola CBS 123094]|uniref:Uncharacterized protein n=1 Tax=Amniculicola lignicola CBS 123094 TaxID=1392246 RepID=A0A6A5WKT2_9PLEO|nr:hypothetical protein P154DRAFT_139512 [Amniculicola lignicola CBS 123094]